MYKIIGGDGKEYGPASADQLRQWLAQGRLNQQTQVQANGGEWKPLGEFPELASSAPPPVVAPVAPKTSGLAIASLLLGCLTLFCSFFTATPGIILGIVGLSKINRSQGKLRGQGMAITGICLSAVLLFFSLGFQAALILPAIAKARSHSQSARCMNNMRQLALGILMYASDNKDTLPDAAHWCDAVKKHAGNDEKLFQCVCRPGERCAYVFNRNLGGVKLAAIQMADRTVLLFEGNGGWNASGTAADLPNTPLHPRGYHIVFVDGHVESVSKEDVDQLQWKPTN